MIQTQNENQDIELNSEFLKALEYMESNSSCIFITGKAGTGKSTLLNHFRANTKKQIAVLAPTGASAVNIKGQTIHSFFGFKPNVTIDSVTIAKNASIYKALDAIVIDEISMVRSDLMDCLDKFLRINRKNLDTPFGGVQMILIGDLYQLPPVVPTNDRHILMMRYDNPYFFSANCMNDIKMTYVELKKIYRQRDSRFVYLLNAVRNNNISDSELSEINDRYCGDINNPTENDQSNNISVYLTTTNAEAEIVNNRMLSSIKEPEFTAHGVLDGKFTQSALPTLQMLKIKTNAQVMMLNNDFSGRYINGTMGKIINIDESYDIPKLIILLENGNKIKVSQYTWEFYSYQLENGELKSKSIGSFTQYPISLAWAITIHKSQGKTFENVTLDVGNGAFSHGQIYVALSRCRKLDGIILKRKILKRHIITDNIVSNFMSSKLNI